MQRWSLAGSLKAWDSCKFANPKNLSLPSHCAMLSRHDRVEMKSNCNLLRFHLWTVSTWRWRQRWRMTPIQPPAWERLHMKFQLCPVSEATKLLTACAKGHPRACFQAGWRSFSSALHGSCPETWFWLSCQIPRLLRCTEKASSSFPKAHLLPCSHKLDNWNTPQQFRNVLRLHFTSPNWPNGSWQGRAAVSPLHKVGSASRRCTGVELGQSSPEKMFQKRLKRN